MISRIRIVLVIALALGCIAALVWAMRTPGMRPIVIYPYEGAMLKPDEKTHDLGIIPTDSKVYHTFLIYNTGGQPLRIHNVETSCGCTVAELSRDVVPPGDFIRLKVALDTSIKLGKTKKTITVHSNDADNPEFKLFLTGNVIHQMKGHEPIEVKDPLVLFKGQCASCHVDRGRGKVGQELFIADCGMCHGLKAEGVPDIAPSLLTQDYADEKTLARVRKVIAEGSPNSPQMPPYSQTKGGPLTDGEIDSLMNFLKYQAMQAKLGLLDTEDEEVEEE